jgi:hypothetical protein
MASFRDTKWIGDTLQRAIYLVDRDTGDRKVLTAGYEATYNARLTGATGTADITATIAATGGETRLAPFVEAGQMDTPGRYDAWLHLHAPDGSLEASLQGTLEIRTRPT